MSLQSVKQFLAEKAPDLSIIEVDSSGATVAMAATAFGVNPGQIAKTLSLSVGEQVILLVARGDARLDNRKYKDQFGAKARFLAASEVEKATGHPVGGVGPFGLASQLDVYCDVSLRIFSEVLPAAGANNAGVRVSPERMAQLVNARWVDVMQHEIAADSPAC
ncbi:YbaK/EbsC family protein [Acidovorax sp. LjRoot117]|uniref:YbaK/EbsC family protein n=1 Tax=Acidovorax sp. LjRoot117 TaxID=3342255 RepID=UPI003ECEDA98